MRGMYMDVHAQLLQTSELGGQALSAESSSANTKLRSPASVNPPAVGSEATGVMSVECFFSSTIKGSQVKVHLDMGVHLRVGPADGTSSRIQDLVTTKSGNMKGDFVLEEENVGKAKRRRSSRRMSFVKRTCTESSAAVASASMNIDQNRTAIQWYKKKRGIPRRHIQAKARNMTTTRHASD